MVKSHTKNQTTKMKNNQSERSNAMITGGVFIALTSIALLAFVIKTKIF